MNKYFVQNRAQLEKEITRSIAAYKKTTETNYPWSEDALSKLSSFANSGKLIRGLLVMLFAGQKNGDALKVGSAVELVHTGILIHDDIMDRDEMRRGLKTIHTQYLNNKLLTSSEEVLHYAESMAMCVGIVSYFIAIKQLANIKDAAKQVIVLSLFADEFVRLGLGQMDDVHTATAPQFSSIDSVLRVYEQKTGRYTFALPILAGLTLAGTNTKQTAKVVYELAKHLGIVFQLQDDILGVFGNSQSTGKSVGGDIREHKITWLYYEAMRRAVASDRKKLKSLYMGKRLLNLSEQKWVLNVMKKYSVQDHAHEFMSKNHQRALELSKQLPLQTAQRKIFSDLLSYLMVRSK